MERARQVVVLGDGAHWIWNQAQMHFLQAIEVLDFWYALERLWNVARTAWGVDAAAKAQVPGEAQEWLEAQKARLETGDKQGFLSTLEALGRVHPRCETIKEALTYYRNNLCRMDYPRYRSLGLDVGSGAAESGCKQVVSQCLKGAGMCWRETGAQAIARLRCLILSRQWQEVESRCFAKTPMPTPT